MQKNSHPQENRPQKERFPLPLRAGFLCMYLVWRSRSAAVPSAAPFILRKQLHRIARSFSGNAACRVQKNGRNVRPLSRTGEGGPATDKMLLGAIMQPLSRTGEGGLSVCGRRPTRKAVCGRRKAVYGRRRRHRTGRFSPARKQLPSNRRRRRPRRRRTGFYASRRRPRRDRRSARRAGRCRWIRSWCRGPRGR